MPEPFDLKAYLPIIMIFVVALGFAGGNLLLSFVMGQRKSSRVKLMPYECGKDPVGSARERFSVKFYLIAMIFILFDIEVIFLVPWAVVYRTLKLNGLGLFAYAEMMVFIALLAAGLAYVWWKGLFDWGEKARREAEAEARTLQDLQARKLSQVKKAA